MTRRVGTVEGEAVAPRRLGLVIGQLTVGGAEHQLTELARGLDRRCFEPVVYSLAEASSSVRATLESLDVPIRVIGSIGLERARRFAVQLARDRVELIHSWLFIANTYAWAARWGGVGAPLITSARNCKSQGWGHHLANVAAFRASARIVVNSALVGDYIARHYRAARRRIDVIYNGIDTQRFRPPTVRAVQPPTVVTVGRLVSQKNPLLFVEAAAQVRQAMPEARFIVVGDGPLRQVMSEQARALGLGDALELAGERRDVERVLSRADAFWLTSSWEGLPNVVLEAMACGVPVVAADVGGTRELLTSGREGFLARPYHVEDFVRYGLTLLRDRELRLAMGAAARRRAEQFSLGRMVEGTQAVYDSVLGDGT